jgi:3-oxoacyl-[acyl-carrier protein] reductase
VPTVSIAKHEMMGSLTLGPACELPPPSTACSALPRALAAELGKDGVRVNAIGPGLIETPLNAHARVNNPNLVKIFLGHTPLERAGKPDDIVGPAIFLASDLSAYVTGSIVMADGGYRSI